jgi:hypothetical protein
MTERLYAMELITPFPRFAALLILALPWILNVLWPTKTEHHLLSPEGTSFKSIYLFYVSFFSSPPGRTLGR